MNLLSNEIHFARSYTITYFSVLILQDFSGALNMVNSSLILIYCQFRKYHRLLIFLDPHCNIPSSCHVEPCSSTWLLRIVIHWSPVLGLLLSSWVSSFTLMTHRYIYLQLDLPFRSLDSHLVLPSWHVHYIASWPTQWNVKVFLNLH